MEKLKSIILPLNYAKEKKMDADGNIIPIVEDDQGEGFKDEIDPQELVGAPELEEKKKAKADFEKLAQESMKPSPPKLMLIKKGMTIHFYGFAYKCTAARPNGKVTLKFKGLWKGDQR